MKKNIRDCTLEELQKYFQKQTSKGIQEIDFLGNGYVAFYDVDECISISVPITHGIEVEDRKVPYVKPYIGAINIQCNNCHKWISYEGTIDLKNYNYCPYCGVSIKEIEDEEH